MTSLNAKEAFIKTLNNFKQFLPVAVAKMLADKNVDIVIAEAIGGNMANALNERGIRYYEKQGVAKGVAQELINM